MRVRGDGEGAARSERCGLAGSGLKGSGLIGSGLIGRGEELGALRRLLAQGRLVTVVGGAGMGKSVLAEHAAAAVGGALPDGVVRVRWWEGGPARGRSVARAVADALDGAADGASGQMGAGGAARTGGGPVGIAELAARLRDRRLLLVLDDFDPVREQCVRLVRALLAEAPGVRVLAAGRHPLGLGEEAVLRLGPLAVVADPGTRVAGTETGVAEPDMTARPGPARSPGTDSFAAGEVGPAAETEVGPAVTLFLTRVRAVRDGLPTGVSRPRRTPGTGGPPTPRSGPGPASPTEPHARSHDTARIPYDGVEFSDDDVRAARDICRRLEGVPLAIELAAVQAAHHPLPRLARLLADDAQGRLSRPDAPLRRHRSLRAAVGAGYALCGTVERTVWARLSVFAGEFDGDAAAFVCGGEGLDARKVPAALARLVLASVLEPVRDVGGVLTARYRMSAAARGFGAERLRSAGAGAAAVSRHQYWYGHVASTAHHLWSTGRHERAMALVRDEEADLRAALTRRPGDADQVSTALALAVDLWFWWAVCGRAAEGRAHLRRLLPMDGAETWVRAQALWLAGWLAVCTDSSDAPALLGEAWQAAVLAGDDATVGRVCHVLGALALQEGRTEQAVAHLRAAADAVAAHAEHGPPTAVSWALLAVAQTRVNPAEARRSARRAATCPQPRHDLWTRSMTQYAQALVDHLGGRRSRAWRRAHKALAGALGVAGVVPATAVPAAAALAAPPGAARVRELIADIEAGRTPSPPLFPRPAFDR